jgi:hypothetical protein
MTDAEKERWKAIHSLYKNARAVALDVLPESAPEEVVQAATATILIKYDKMSGRAGTPAPVVKAPTAAAPARTPAPHPQAAPAAIAVPHCPRCSGPMWDNRTNKKSPRGPDFKCKDQNCKDEKGFVTAIFPRDLAKMAHVQSFAEPPAALAEPGDDSLPFDSGRGATPASTRHAGPHAPSGEQVAFFQRLIDSPVFTKDERDTANEWLNRKATRQTIKDQIDWLKRQIESRMARTASIAQ